MRIVALYDQQLVHGEGEEELGRMLRHKFCETQEAVLQVRLNRSCSESDQRHGSTWPGSVSQASNTLACIAQSSC